MADPTYIPETEVLSVSRTRLNNNFEALRSRIASLEENGPAVSIDLTPLQSVDVSLATDIESLAGVVAMKDASLFTLITSIGNDGIAATNAVGAASLSRDASLQTQVMAGQTSLATALLTADTSLASALTSEVGRAIAAESSLSVLWSDIPVQSQPTVDDLDDGIVIQGGDTVFPYPWEALRLFTHCASLANGSGATTGDFIKSGVGSANIQSSISSGRFGIFSLFCTSTAGLSSASINAANLLSVGITKEVRLRAEISPYASLYDAVNTGDIQVGFSSQNTISATLPNIALMVRSRNGGNYTLVASNAGGETTLDLGIPPIVGTFVTIEIVIPAGRGSIYAILNGVQSDPITTNTTTGTLGAWVGVTRTNATSTTSNGILVDYVAVYTP